MKSFTILPRTLRDDGTTATPALVQRSTKIYLLEENSLSVDMDWRVRKNDKSKELLSLFLIDSNNLSFRT